MKRLFIGLLPLLVALNLQAEGLFSAGQKNFGFSAGSSTGFGNTYTVIGANFNYFVQDGLSVGVGYQGWFGDDPKINEINIPITYYYEYTPQYYPYMGFRYAHTSISDGYDDYNTYGARVGLAMSFGNNSYMSVGWVQDYREKDGDSDSDGYPEVSMGIAF
jgi:hypothetical protein